MGETQIQAKLDLHQRKQLAQVFSFLKQFIIQTNYNLCKEKKLSQELLEDPQYQVPDK